MIERSLFVKTSRESGSNEGFSWPFSYSANIPTPGKLQDAFAMMLDSDIRVVIEVVPEKWITFDATKMMMSSIEAWKEMGILDED